MKVVISENAESEFADPKVETRKNGKKECIALNEQQEADLLRVSYESNYKHGLMIDVALNSGVRVNELVCLIISDLNLDRKNPTIRIQDRPVGKYNGPFMCKTDLSNRTIPITIELSEKLRAFIGVRKTGYVFQSQRKIGRDFDFIRKDSMIKAINTFAKIIPSIGKNVGFHTTRRTYASKLLDRGVPINQIALLLGHSSISVTLNYLKTVRKIDQNLVREALKPRE